MSLRVPAVVGVSDIHGTGLFALKPIAKGTIVWLYDPDVDLLFGSRPEGRLADWAWQEEDAWVVPGDNARYVNHSDHPNIDAGHNRREPDLANRDIAAGEELTMDYSRFDLDWPNYCDQYKRG